MGDPEMMRVMQSLIHIPSVFESNGVSIGDDLMVAQAVRQNFKATMTLPRNTLEWAGMPCGLAALGLAHHRCKI
jgi:hypothetical protein